MATNLERLKTELRADYLNNETEYEMFLQENDLNPSDTYDKTSMRKKLMQTTLDVLKAVMNDVNLYRKIETEFATTGGANSFFNKRIADLEREISYMPDNAEQEKNSSVFMMWHD